MNITFSPSVNFKARFQGDYGKIKDMAITNGLSAKVVNDTENKIHEAFPNTSFFVKSSYNSGTQETSLNIKIHSHETFIATRFDANCMNRNLKIKTETEEDIKNLFLKMTEAILKMKPIYNPQNHAKITKN